MPCIVESPVASTEGSATSRTFVLPPTATKRRTRWSRTRNSTRQRPRCLARKRRVCTATARAKATVLHVRSPPGGVMQSLGRMPPMFQRSITRTRASRPGSMRLGASTRKRCAHDGVRTPYLPLAMVPSGSTTRASKRRSRRTHDQVVASFRVVTVPSERARPSPLRSSPTRS